MLAGVLLASLLPPLLAAQFAELSYRWLAAIFAITLLVGVSVTLRLPVFRHVASTAAAMPVRWYDFMTCLRDAPTRYVLLVLLLNSIPSAITGTLFLFFTADVLHATDTQAGLLLVLYFISAAVAIPLWSMLSRHIGLRRSLAAGMVLAIVSFVFAYGLGRGDIAAFAIICAVSGAAVGADLALLPAMFARALQRMPEVSGVGFGLWHFTNKLTLALAAGVALPLLAWAGYVPAGSASINVLSLAYAAIPCLMKLGAFAVLMFGAPKQEEFP
jgi:GPH family glycoside/pentoside/hexuronide:cation symporter